MTVEALEPRFTMRELLDWESFEADFGPITLHERIDAAAARIAYVIAVAQGLKNERGGDLEPTDFLPRWERASEAPSAADWFKAMAS